MYNKKRLFEVFNKINHIVINEQITKEIEDIKDDINDDIKRHFSFGNSSKLFSEGIPFKLTVNINNQNTLFEINDSGGYDIENIETGKYVVTYVTDLGKINPQFNGVNVFLRIPFVTEIVKNITNDNIEFYIKNNILSNEIDVEYSNE